MKKEVGTALSKIINLESIKESCIHYAKIRKMSSDDVMSFIISSIVKVAESIGINLTEDEILKEKTDEIYVDNPYEFTNRLEREILQSINLHKISTMKSGGYLDTIIEAEVNIIRPGLLIGDYNGMEVVVDGKSLVRHDRLRPGDTVKLLATDYIVKNVQAKIIATRRGKRFLERLLYDSVEEIREGLVSIKHIKRFEGIKNYVVVSSKKGSLINPIKMIVGIDGIRIKDIKRHLTEKIEIIDHGDDKEDQDVYRSVLKEDLIRIEPDGKIILRRDPENHDSKIEIMFLDSYFEKEHSWEYE